MRKLGWVLVCVFLASCNSYESKQLQQATTPDLRFKPMVDTFFKPYCLGCHGNTHHSGGVSLESYKEMVEGGYLVPGDPESSLVYTLSRDGEMPPRDPKPPAELVDSLQAWIAAGAPQ